MDPAYDAELMKQLGHFDIAIVRKSNGRCYVLCECGYQSATRVSQREAVEAAMHHRRKVAQEVAINGVSVRGSVARLL